VPVDIIHAGGTATVTVNQQANNGVWTKLGRWNFNAGTAGKLVIRNTATNGFVIADAAQFTPAGIVPPPVVEIVTADTTAREISSGTPDKARFSIVRTGDVTAAVTVSYTVGGSATAGDDFAVLSGSLVLNAGQTSGALDITALSDALVEGDESLTLTIQPGAGYTTGTLVGASVTLRDGFFDAWRFSQFTPAQLSIPAMSGPDADPDHDSVVNLMEFWSGSSPFIAGPPVSPVLETAGQPALTIIRHRDAAGLFFRAERSDDLITWAPAQSAGSIIAVEEQSPRQYLRIPLQPLPAGRSFFRVAVSTQYFPDTILPSRAFFSFDALQDGTGTSSPVATASMGFSYAPVIAQNGTVFVSDGGAASFTDYTGATWLGSGSSGTPGHCLGWNPGSTGNQFTLTFDATGLHEIRLRMDIRSASAAGGTPPAQFASFTYDSGSGPQAVAGAGLTFPADNTFHEWTADLSAVSAINGQGQVTLTWTIEDLAAAPSPIESFRIDNIQLTAEPVP